MADSRRDAIDTAKRFLAEKHCTLWSMFDVSDDEGQETAATWLIDVMYDLLAYAEAEAAS